MSYKKKNRLRSVFYIDLETVLTDMYEKAKKSHQDIKTIEDYYSKYIIPQMTTVNNNLADLPYLKASFSDVRIIDLIERIEELGGEAAWKIVSVDCPNFTESIRLQKKLWVQNYFPGKGIFFLNNSKRINNFSSESSNSKQRRILIDGIEEEKKIQSWVKNGGIFISHKTFEQTKKAVSDAIRYTI